MKCSSCGNEINELSKFCGYCGNKIAESDVPVEAAGAVEEPMAEESAVEEPAVEEPAVEEPAVEEPVVEEPVVEGPAVEEPAAEEPVVEEPAVEEPAVEEPAIEEPAIKEPAVEAPAVEESAVEESAVEESVIEEPVGEKPVIEEPVAEEPVGTAAEIPAAGSLVFESGSSQPPKKKNSMIFAAIAVAVIAVLGVTALFKAGGTGTSGQTKVVYFTKDSIMMADISRKSEPVEVTDSWNEDKNSTAMVGASWKNYLSKDGRFIYYIQKCEGSGYYLTFDLYKAPISNLADAVKIDSKVNDFEVLDNNHVIYERKDTLYYHDGENKLKIGKDIWQYQLTEDQSHVIWQETDKNDEMTLYYQPLDQSEEKTELISGISSTAYYFEEDMQNIYLLDDNVIYKLSPGAKKEKLVKKVEEIVSCDPFNEVFYFTREGKDQLELYYYADGAEELICDDVVTDDSGYSYRDYSSSNGAYCFFREYDGKDEIYKLAIGSMVVELDDFDEGQIGWRNTYFTEVEDGMKLYLLNFDEDDEAIMYEAVMYGDNIGDLIEVDTEVSSVGCVTDAGVYYLKDKDDEGGDLYLNGEVITSEVYDAFALPESNNILLMTDYDLDDHCGTIVLYDGKTLTTVAENITAVEAAADGTLLMLSDYNIKRYRGDLLYYNGKEVNHIAEDVKGFLSRPDSYLRNYYYNYYY